MSETSLELLQKNLASNRKFANMTFAGTAKLKPFPMGKDLTNSARSTFMNCRRKYQYSYVLGLAPRKPSIPFLVGGLYHDALDRAYTSGAIDIDEEQIIARKACEKASKAQGLTGEESDKIWVQSTIVVGLLKGYEKQWFKQDIKRWEVIQAEGAFDVAMPGGWRYRGKTDLVVRDKKTKRVKLVEHKTTSRLDAGYVAKLPLDNQILGYIWAKNQEKLGIKEVVYNVARKPGIRLKQNESLDQFAKRIIDEYSLNTAAYYYRETLTFDPKDVDRFKDELFRFMEEVDRAQTQGYYSQNTTQCTVMGVCPFMKLCLEGVNDDALALYRIKERAHEELPENEDD
jgi:hypothetical protein